jgi:hypothetical protein
MAFPAMIGEGDGRYRMLVACEEPCSEALAAPCIGISAGRSPERCARTVATQPIRGKACPSPWASFAPRARGTIMCTARPPVRALLVLMTGCAAFPLLFGCSSKGAASSSADAGPSGAAPDQSWPVAPGTPQVIAPTQPGLLTIGPPGLQLMPSTTSKLTASLFDSQGNPQTTPALTWSTGMPDVATVDSDGTVHAVAVGPAVITVTDGVHGTRSVTVTVTTTPASGPTGATFGAPIVILNVGRTSKPTVALSDANGTPVGGAMPVTIVGGGSAGLDLSQPGVIKATAPGMAIANASLGSSTIDGEMLVVVEAASTSANLTGQSATVRIQVIRRQVASFWTPVSRKHPPSGSASLA